MRVKTPQQAEKILTAAAQLFATHRFHEARMEDIASLAEVGKGTLYRYFEDKEELYLALLEQASEGLQARLREACDETRPPTEQLLQVVEALIAYFDEEPHVLELINHAEAMQRSGTEFPWQATRRQTITLIRELFESGERAGELYFRDVETAVLMLLGGLRAVIRFGKRPRPGGLAAEIVESFLSGHRVAREDERRQIVDAGSLPLHNA